MLPPALYTATPSQNHSNPVSISGTDSEDDFSTGVWSQPNGSNPLTDLEPSIGDEISPSKEDSERTDSDQSHDYSDESLSVHNEDLSGYQSLNVTVYVPEDPRVEDVPDQVQDHHWEDASISEIVRIRERK